MKMLRSGRKYGLVEVGEVSAFRECGVRYDEQTNKVEGRSFGEE
jgi:hypothetical protein